MNTTGKRILLGVALAAAVAGIGAAVLAPRPGWFAAPPSAMTLYGNVDIRQSHLGFRVGGRIDRLLVDEGDPVTAGMVLARLDPGPNRDRERSALAAAARQAADLDRLVAGPRPAEIAQGRALHAERLADLRNADLTLDRVRRLRASDTVAQSALDQAEAARAMAAARAQSARESLRLLEQGTRAEEIAAARAALASAEADLAAARTALGDTELVAPADGVILSRVREAGAVVAAGDTVLTVSLREPVWVRAYVAEPDLGRIHPGMAVEVLTDSAPGHPYPATIGFISPVAEFTPKSVETTELRADLVYRLRVVVDRADPSLRQGMPVSVRVPLDAGAGHAGAGR